MRNVEPFRPYEIDCEKCGGTGDVDDNWGPDTTCGRCKGGGVELSEEGYGFIEFLKRHMKLKKVETDWI